MTELSLQVQGATIAGRLHGDSRWPSRVLCVHGQADNAASFDGLAPLLVAREHAVFAMDLSGHGRSSWRPIYDPVLWTLEVLQVLDALGWDLPILLLGHSFGQSVLTMFAAAYPERVSGVVLIEGLGLWDRCLTEDQAPGAILRRRLDAAAFRRPPRSMTSVDDALRVRLSQLAKATDTGVSISEHAARPIVERGTVTNDDGSVRWSHDPALFSGTSFARMSHEDSRELLGRMPPHCLLIHCGARTYPDIPLRTAARRSAVRGLEELLFPEESHHLHADRPELLAPRILAFMERIRQAPSITSPCSASRL